MEIVQVDKGVRDDEKNGDSGEENLCHQRILSFKRGCLAATPALSDARRSPETTKHHHQDSVRCCCGAADTIKPGSLVQVGTRSGFV